VENRRKHDLGLEAGIEPRNAPNLEYWIDDITDYGEIRDMTLGMSRLGILFVVSTLRANDLTRILSARKAEKNEKSCYDHGLP
jgi:uncharacterized DUF497 family protein